MGEMEEPTAAMVKGVTVEVGAGEPERIFPPSSSLHGTLHPEMEEMSSINGSTMEVVVAGC